MERTIERRRSIRLKRSALLREGLDSMDRPSIKIADNWDEYTQAFQALYQSYYELEYIPPNDLGMYCTFFHFLPVTQVFVFKSYLSVISTMSRVYDSELFGLPMDIIYKPELDLLREQGRKLLEVCSFATPRDKRWSNAMMFIKRSIVLQSTVKGYNDICIMVNPKHVSYYKDIFLFEELGPEREYGKFKAPAVGLRLNLDTYREDLKQAYGSADFDTNLYEFFYAREQELKNLKQSSINKHSVNRPLPLLLCAALVTGIPTLAENLNDKQLQFFEREYNLSLEKIVNIQDQIKAYH